MRVKDVFDPGWLLNPAKVFPLALHRRPPGGVGAVCPAAPHNSPPRDLDENEDDIGFQRTGIGRSGGRGRGAAARSGRWHARLCGGYRRRGVVQWPGCQGSSSYEPGALTIVARAGTPVAEVEAALAAEGQRLPFEPMDHRALMGTRRHSNHWRRCGGQCLGAAAGAGRGMPRQPDRRAVRGWARRCDQERRPRDEERYRL